MTTDDPHKSSPYLPLTSAHGWIIISATFAVLLACDLLLIYYFDEYEPEYPIYSVIGAFILDLILTVLFAGPLIIAVEIGRRSKRLLAVYIGVLLLAFGIFTTFDTYKHWAARRVVQHVYWHNSYRAFHGKQSFTDLTQFEQPRWHLLLHGFTQLKNDPWGHPYHYELTPESVDHPHRKNWYANWVFWSNGPDGRDDGHQKHDDIDITNAGL